MNAFLSRRRALPCRRRFLADIALCALMRDALLRRSEASALRWGDVDLRADGTGRAAIRRSKTDQAAEGAVGFLSSETVRDLRRIRPADAPVFDLSPSQVSRRIRSAALAAGLENGAAFSGHSPRVGMARDLAAAGTEIPALMQAGRWKSARMPALYTRNEAAGRGAVAQYYARRGA